MQRKTHLLRAALAGFAVGGAATAFAQAPAAPASAFNAEDPCRAEVSKFEQAIAYVRKARGAQAASDMKEKWLPAKVESELLLSQGYCGIARHLRTQKWNR